MNRFFNKLRSQKKRSIGGQPKLGLIGLERGVEPKHLPRREYQHAHQLQGSNFEGSSSGDLKRARKSAKEETTIQSRGGLERV